MNWQTHPSLKDKLHPDHPNDLQVVVHDGGPRITKNQPEAVWVTITGLQNGVFSGTVLNAPRQLQSVTQNQVIEFLADNGTKHPAMVTKKYLREKQNWIISPCTECGFSELFDAPSDLIKVIFPNIPPDAVLEGFTSFCPLCGGVQTIESRISSEEVTRRPWWKFWGKG